MSDISPFPYTAYLLRLWPVDDRMGTVWRAHLENTRTGQKQGFASLTALMAYLEKETGEQVLCPDDDGRNTAVSPK